MKTYEGQIAQLISLKDEGVLEESAIETKITFIIIEIHDTVTRLLNENSIIKSESDKSKNALQIVIREVLKLQDTFLSLGNSSQWDTEEIIKSMKPQLETSLGAAMSEEMGDTLLSMKSVFDESFGQLKSHIEAIK